MKWSTLSTRYGSMFGKLSSFLLFRKEEEEEKERKNTGMKCHQSVCLAWHCKITRFWREYFLFFSELVASLTLGNWRARWWWKVLYSGFASKSNLGLVGLTSLDLFARYNDLALGLERNSFLFKAFLYLLLTRKNLTFSRQVARDVRCFQWELQFSSCANCWDSVPQLLGQPCILAANDLYRETDSEEGHRKFY